MSQRNPLNERYQADEKSGKTRKSAASAKPVKKAASSVYIANPDNKPKENFLTRLFDRNKGKQAEDDTSAKKASAQETDQESGGKQQKKKGPYTLLDMEGDDRQGQNLTKEDRKAANKKYYNPGTSAYKKWRILWWVVIGLGVCSLIPPVARPDLFVDNEQMSMIFYGLGWMFLIAAVAIDALKIRPLRKDARYGASKDKSKAATAARKEMRKKEEEEAARKAAKKKKK